MTYEHLNHEAVLFFWLSNLIFRLFKKFLKHKQYIHKAIRIRLFKCKTRSQKHA